MNVTGAGNVPEELVTFGDFAIEKSAVKKMKGLKVAVMTATSELSSSQKTIEDKE
jgi:hypothetical protein